MQNILLLYSYHIHVQIGFYSLPIQCIFRDELRSLRINTSISGLFFSKNDERIGS